MLKTVLICLVQDSTKKKKRKLAEVVEPEVKIEPEVKTEIDVNAETEDEEMENVISEENEVYLLRQDVFYLSAVLSFCILCSRSTNVLQ